MQSLSFSHVVLQHAHLGKGGVPDVIITQLNSLALALPEGASLDVTILHGGRSDSWPSHLQSTLNGKINLELKCYPAFEYDRKGLKGEEDPVSQSTLYDILAETFVGKDPKKSILHTHNAGLGKVANLVPAISKLAGEKGVGILFQVHDLPEDGRPNQYSFLSEQLEDPGKMIYPQAGHIHYAFINGRDQGIFQAAGLMESNSHLLPNPAPEQEDLPEHSQAKQKFDEIFPVANGKRLILYPVRGIGRKNLMEVLLYAALAPDDVIIAQTLAPTNNSELPAYNKVKHLAKKLQLPCLFGVGDSQLNFSDIYAAADKIITTSVAEGFGIVFLQSFLRGRPLIGRDIPDITRDFKARGLNLEALSSSIKIPVNLIDIQEIKKAWSTYLASTHKVYGRELSKEVQQAFLDAKIQGNTIDFADLTVSWQEKLIDKICIDPAVRQTIVEENPFLVSSMELDFGKDYIQHNRQVALTEYSMRANGDHLLKIYNDIITSSRTRIQSIPNPKAILLAFLANPYDKRLVRNPNF